MKIKRFALGPLWTNVYLISDESGNAVLIDPAAESQVVLDFIKQNDFVLHAVLLTHGHIDHISGLTDAGLYEFVKGEVYVHPSDSKMLTDPEKEFSQRLGFHFDGVPSVKNINDGDKLKFGSLCVSTIGTPGHTQGSVCYMVNDVLFSGDTLFADGVGRTDLPGGNEAMLQNSLLILQKLSPELEVYPGHGPSTTISDELHR